MYFKFIDKNIILVQTLDRVYIRDLQKNSIVTLGNLGIVLSSDAEISEQKDSIVIVILVLRKVPQLELYYYDQQSLSVQIRQEPLPMYPRASKVQIFGYNSQSYKVKIFVKGDYTQLEMFEVNRDPKQDKRIAIFQQALVASEKELTCLKVLYGVLFIANKESAKFIDLNSVTAQPKLVNDNRIKLDFEAPHINFAVEVEDFYYFATKDQLIKVPKADVAEERSQRLLDLAVNVIQYQHQIIGLQPVGPDDIVVVHTV
ncbi:Hypothetical_protein [Hexamita inflata]|uniref:Hypothetical_protein n=1 Tax=Hexamita inflata TaxID=28002 RepID=A0AA86NTS6_9EUKA|nr:Hypothetical protein HINF_LOCUS13600 [Hexamita inflata]